MLLLLKLLGATAILAAVVIVLAALIWTLNEFSKEIRGKGLFDK